MAGTTTYTATLGEYSSVKTVASAKLSHKYTNYISDDNATCQQDGTKTAECDYGCGETDTVIDEGSRLAHTPVGKWIVTRKASPELDGAMVRKCKACGETVEAAGIPSIGRMKLESTRFVYDGKAKTNGARYLYKVCVYRKNASLILKSSSSAPKTIYYVAAPKCSSVTNSAAGSLKVICSRNAKVSGYQIQYALNAKFTGAKTVTAAGYKTTTKAITKLKKNKKYYVRVRGYKKVKGVIYYSSWSAAKSAVVKK